ncbi:CMRF35-like molecule 1 [Austrofundulus limnaeus]|uniref:CMRF35-like molecule 1 n=1 Tax=Austrofundulus limnaeus TaxID=52670 RepID=A0A2I4CTI3_AUSLI|nr:PREDICTED: CMRF35-like molecule 1 [Austrofundulus limnaeus]
MWNLQPFLIVLCSVFCCVTRSAAVLHVFGYESRNVIITCSYGRGYEDYEKYLCKNDCSYDDVLIKTSQREEKKYSINDYKTRSFFTATISDLCFNDTGKYWCGVTRNFIPDILTEVKLEVTKDVCCEKVSEIQGSEEGSVSISCLYESKYEKKLKYICRGKQPSTCLQQALITSDNKPNKRFTISDDKMSKTFTVTISKLTLKDSGPYLCGVHRDEELDVFSAVELEVKASPQPSTTVWPITTAGQVTSASPTQEPVKVSTSLYAILFVPALVLLIPIFTLVKVCKHRCYKEKETKVATERACSPTEAVNSQEASTVADIYVNGDHLKMLSKQKTSKEHSADYRFGAEDEGEPEYENFTAEAEDIYCNMPPSKTHRK